MGRALALQYQVTYLLGSELFVKQFVIVEVKI